jgi:hypothetical protein
VNTLVTVIVACEIAFWIVLVSGLVARYVLRRRRLGAILLACVPLVDLVLLGASVLDLSRGARAEAAHGLAAAYLGFSVAFGASLVRWADERFAHRFANGPAPWRPPRYGRERTRYEWQEFGKALVAWAISCGLLLAAIAFVGDADRTEALQAWIARLTVVVAIWSLWPITHTLWPARPKAGAPPGT